MENLNISLASPKKFKAYRVSSYDRKGGNADYIKNTSAGETKVAGVCGKAKIGGTVCRVQKE
jgi:hypothetical protein